MDIITNPTPEIFDRILSEGDVPVTYQGVLWRASKREVGLPDMPEDVIDASLLPTYPGWLANGYEGCWVESFRRTNQLGMFNQPVMHDSESISQEWLSEIMKTDYPTAWKVSIVSHPCETDHEYEDECDECDGSGDTLEGWVLLSARIVLW